MSRRLFIIIIGVSVFMILIEIRTQGHVIEDSYHATPIVQTPIVTGSYWGSGI